MPALWLAQLLCPQRHAICGLLYDTDKTPKSEIEQTLRKLIDPTERPHLDPWCILCESRDLHIEHRKLATDDWDKELRILRVIEQQNIAARALFLQTKRNVN